MVDEPGTVTNAGTPLTADNLNGEIGTREPKISSSGLPVNKGGTGAITPTNARSNLGLGNVPNVDATNANNISTGTLDKLRLPTDFISAGNNVTASRNSTTGQWTISAAGGGGSGGNGWEFMTWASSWDSYSVSVSIPTTKNKTIHFDVQVYLFDSNTYEHTYDYKHMLFPLKLDTAQSFEYEVVNIGNSGSLLNKAWVGGDRYVIDDTNEEIVVFAHVDSYSYPNSSLGLRVIARDIEL